MANLTLPAISYQGSRGCKNRCRFCPSGEFGGPLRVRDADNGLEYLARQIEQTGAKQLFFEDLSGVKDIDFLHRFEDLLNRTGHQLNSTMFTRVEDYKNRELLDAWRNIGVISVTPGFESLNPETLKAQNKRTLLPQYEYAVDAFHDAGLGVNGMFLMGFDTDKPEDLTKIKEFVLKTGMEKFRLGAMARVPEIEGQDMPAYRIFTWDELEPYGEDLVDYCIGEFVTFFPLNMKPSELQRGIIDVQNEIISGKSLLQQFSQTWANRGLYPTLERIRTMIGYAVISRSLSNCGYIEILEDLEKPFYDSSGRLLEDKLIDRYGARKS